jgi:hypothetical protein
MRNPLYDVIIGNVDEVAEQVDIGDRDVDTVEDSIDAHKKTTPQS